MASVKSQVMKASTVSFWKELTHLITKKTRIEYLQLDVFAEQVDLQYAFKKSQLDAFAHMS